MGQITTKYPGKNTDILIFYPPLQVHITCSIIHADTRENVGDRVKRHDFDQTVSRKHYLTKQDVRNISAKVTDNLVKKHKEDALSVQLTVEELQQEPFDPVLIYKPQGVTNPNYPTLTEEHMWK